MAEPKRKGRPPKPKEIVANSTEEAAQEIVKRGRGGANNPKLNFGYENVKPGDNAKATMFVVALSDFEKISLADDKAVEQRLTDYWQLCIDHDTKPLVSGMADALGIDRRRLWEIVSGQPRTLSEKNLSNSSMDLIKKAYGKMATLWEHYMMNGKVNPVSGIFLGKNMFGMKDQSEVVLTPNQPLGSDADPATLAEKYTQALPESVED